MGEGKAKTLRGTGRQKQDRWGKGYKPLQGRKKITQISEFQRDRQPSRKTDSVTRSRFVNASVWARGNSRGF